MHTPNLQNIIEIPFVLKGCSVFTVECSNSAHVTLRVSVNIVGCGFSIQCMCLWVKYVQ